jgi:hypothetical protein
MPNDGPKMKNNEIRVSQFPDDSRALARAVKMAFSWDGRSTVIVDRPCVVSELIHAASRISWDIRERINIVPNARLSICGPIRAHANEIFRCIRPTTQDEAPVIFHAADHAQQCSPFVYEIPVMWFDGGEKNCLGERTQKAIAAGGRKAVVSWPSCFGPWNPNDPRYGDQQWAVIHDTIDYDHRKFACGGQTLRGQSHIGSTAVIARNAGDGDGIIAIDAMYSDELSIQGVHIAEQAGSRLSTCLRTGGTDLQVIRCWFVVAKVGVNGSSGGKTHCEENGIEGCDTGLFISNQDSKPHFAYEFSWEGGWLGRNVIGIHYHMRPGGHVYRGHHFNHLKIKKSRQYAILIDCHSPDYVTPVFTGCTVRRTGFNWPQRVEPYAGVYVKNGAFTWTGGEVFDNGGRSQSASGFYVEGNSWVRLSNIFWGDYWPNWNWERALYEAHGSADVRAENCRHLWSPIDDESVDDPGGSSEVEENKEESARDELITANW